MILEMIGPPSKTIKMANKLPKQIKNRVELFMMMIFWKQSHLNPLSHHQIINVHS